MSFQFSVNNSGLANALFGSQNDSGNVLGDYHLIRTGAYKKLLKAYYGKGQEADIPAKNEKESKPATTVSKEDTALQSIRTGAENLKSAASKLNNASLYTEVEAEDGTVTYDKEKIKSHVENFIAAYNQYAKVTGESNQASISRQNLSVMKATVANAKLLKEVGIGYDKSGQLSLDSEKFAKASVKTLQSVFQGNGSYADTVADRAETTYRLANSALYNQKDGASYASNGTYSLLGNTNQLLDRLL